MTVDRSQVRRGAGVAFVLVFVGIVAAAGCQDVSEFLTLRDEVRDQLGYERIEVGVQLPENRVVLTLQNPSPDASPAGRETARRAAVLARGAHARTRDSDSIEVVFEETRDDGGLVSSVTRRSFTFATSAVSEEPE